MIIEKSLTITLWFRVLVVMMKRKIDPTNEHFASKQRTVDSKGSLIASRYQVEKSLPD